MLQVDFRITIAHPAVGETLLMLVRLCCPFRQVVVLPLFLAAISSLGIL